jgi:hypothetical protein
LKTTKILHVIIALFFVAASVLAAGCAQKTTRTTKEVDQTQWEWVPRVWVEDNSFGGASQYNRCSYDIKTEGYWCPPGTK